jgi:hypothetical protein
LDYPVRHYDQDWFRLIPSRFPPVDVYERLGALIRTAAPEIEMLTNPRLAARMRLVGGPAAVDVNSPRLQNWNHAPFVYRNPEGSFLLNPVHGVMEVADSIEASLAFAICRRETFLSRTREAPMDLDMRLLSTRIAGDFVDLTGLEADTEQTTRWKIGEELLRAGAPGAVFRRPEHPEGRFLALFDPTLLERSVQGTHYRFVWDGTVVKSVYDFGNGQEIARGDLVSGKTGRDAA